MQSYFIKQTSSELDQYLYITPKVSSTSTADSYTPISGYYDCLEDTKEDTKEDDHDLLMKFNSLGLDELDNEEVNESSGPHRDASELLHSEPTVKVRPKLSYGPLQESAAQENTSSIKCEL